MNEIAQRSDRGPDYFRHNCGPEILENLWTVDWGAIEHLELIPGFRMSADIWILPHSWTSWGQGHHASQRTIDFSKHLPSDWDRADARSENAVRRLKRVAVMMFTRTLKITQSVRSPKQPRSWVADVKMLLKLAGHALTILGLRDAKTSCPDGDPIFASLTDEQFKTVISRYPASAGSNSVLPRLNALLAHGDFDDWPATDVGKRGLHHCKRQFQPFDDDFTSVLAAASLWMSEEIGPDIIDCWVGLLELRAQLGKQHNYKAAPQYKEFLAKFIRERALEQVNFKFLISVRTFEDGRSGFSRKMARWTDLTPGSMRYLVAKLQDAHAILLALCMAPRNSELASLPRNCLRECDGGGLIRGYTFKLSEREEERDWPIPSVAVNVVRQQRKIAEIIDPGGAKLFVSFMRLESRQNLRDKIFMPTNAFTDFVYFPDGRSLTSICNGKVHSHRIRKTVARLAALALVGANQILFDILGHRDPEMTLNYILADPSVQDEMRQIAKEAALATAKSAFDDFDGNGGPAAASVAAIAGRLKVRSGADELDERSLATAATLLSQDGHVTLVKKGVLCTKTSSQMGECVRSLGVPDIGNCKATCLHRLELAAAKSDHRRAIGQALEEIANAGPLMKPWWQGQILTHLVPFPDLRVEMLADTRVKNALEDIDHTTLEQLWSKSPAEAAQQLEKMT